MIWNRFENFIGEKIPRCIKTALEMCCFDTILSLCEIKPIHIGIIENHINQHRHEQIEKMHCNHSDYYRNIEKFRFLPGHEAIILALPKYATQFQEVLKSSVVDTETKTDFTLILNEMIKTAESNKDKDSNHATYSDTIRFFATYVFLMCGRSCYEMLRTNLPLPSTKTICEYSH